MSAGTSFIRLRLHFDYPPPAAVGCRMCWLLVDVNACRVVADLESTIRERFGFSRGSIFNLFIQDCYLPHTESIYIVRDNDDIRVKVEFLAQVNGHDGDPDDSREKRRKRQRGSEDDGPGENGVEAKCKKKKKKKRCEENASEDVASATGDQKSAGKKHTEKKKKKNSCAASPIKTPATVDLVVKGKKKLPASPVKRQKPPSSDSSSSSSDEVSKKTASKTSSSTPSVSRTPPNTKPTQKKPQPPSSSSSDTETSSDEAPRPTTTTDIQSTSSVQKPAAEPQNRDEEDEDEEEEEIKLVIKKPLPPGRIFAGLPPQRGRGRGRDILGGPGPGRQGPPETSRTVRAQNGPESRYSSFREPSYQTDSLVNKSVVLQNEAESVQKRDYSSMPLLAAPPQVGQKIAFKLLELTENYTPEVSEYKEGKIMSFDPATKQMELELLNASQAPTEPGKFDLVYQNPDGSERVEYAVTRGSRVTERWESLLEPRLII